MAVQVRIPTPLRKFTDGKDTVEGNGSSITEIIADLDGNFPGLKDRICDEDGTVKRFVNLYLNGDDIRFLDDIKSAVKDGDEISIVPAIAGGC